jgi:hypothetical protein
MPARTSFTGTPVFLPHRLFVKQKITKSPPRKTGIFRFIYPNPNFSIPSIATFAFPTLKSGIVYFSCGLFTPEIAPQQKSFIEKRLVSKSGIN